MEDRREHYRRALVAAVETARESQTAEGRAYWETRVRRLREALSTMTHGRVRWS